MDLRAAVADLQAQAVAKVRTERWRVGDFFVAIEDGRAMFGEILDMGDGSMVDTMLHPEGEPSLFPVLSLRARIGRTLYGAFHARGWPAEVALASIEAHEAFLDAHLGPIGYVWAQRGTAGIADPVVLCCQRPDPFADTLMAKRSANEQILIAPTSAVQLAAGITTPVELADALRSVEQDEGWPFVVGVADGVITWTESNGRRTVANMPL